MVGYGKQGGWLRLILKPFLKGIGEGLDLTNKAFGKRSIYWGAV